MSDSSIAKIKRQLAKDDINEFIASNFPWSYLEFPENIAAVVCFISLRYIWTFACKRVSTDRASNLRNGRETERFSLKFLKFMIAYNRFSQIIILQNNHLQVVLLVGWHSIKIIDFSELKSDRNLLLQYLLWLIARFDRSRHIYQIIILISCLFFRYFFILRNLEEYLKPQKCNHLIINM